MRSGGEKSVAYAQSSGRVLALVIHNAEADVRLGLRTPAQAFSTVRRKYEKLRAEYLRIPLGTEDDWKNHGPDRAYADCHERLFPGMSAKEGERG